MAILGLFAFAPFCAGCREKAHSIPAHADAEAQAEIRTMYEGYRAEFPGVKGITADELVKRRGKEDVVVIDVREPKERAVSIIPGAITREEFEAKKKAASGKPIVAYCTIGYRSGRYVQELNKEGIPALNLEGGILAWVNASQPVVDSKGAPAKRVHTYSNQWALLPDGYEAVY